MTDREYLVALYSFTHFGPARTRLLLSYFTSAKNSWEAGERDLLKIGLRGQAVRNFRQYRDSFDNQSYFSRLKKLGVSFVTFLDEDFPENLKELEDAPCVLYSRGKLKKSDSNAVAIIGARKMTSYGKEVAEKFATELASLGITIVSGLARGIDSVAHRSALTSCGRTIAVLGSGLDQIYPPENTQLAKQISASGSAVISEYPLGYPAYRTNFASRNRIISGLSKAVLVVEGQERSGTLLTASHAADQGRAVFAVPGSILSVMSQAPLFLLKNGAKLATSTKDVLEELDLQLKVNKEVVEALMPANEGEGELLEILINEPLHLDEVARISGLKVSEVSARLTVMELKGMVKNLGGGIYKKV